MKKKERTVVLTESQLKSVIDYAFVNYGNGKLNESNLFDEFKFLNESEDDEDDNSEAAADKVDKVTDEQLRIDSLKIAVKLSRLMNKVTAEDLLEISTKVASYLKNHKVGEDYEPEESENVPLENEEVQDNEGEGNDDVENTEDVEMPEDVEEFTLEDDVEDEDTEDTNESGSDIPEEFIL